jgi:hypothetical protein
MMQCHPPEEQNLQLRRYENFTHRITALLPYPLTGHHMVLRSFKKKLKTHISFVIYAIRNQQRPYNSTNFSQTLYGTRNITKSLRTDFGT